MTVPLEDLKDIFRQLRASISVLALPPERQADWVRVTDDELFEADELALQYELWSEMVPQLLDEDLLSPEEAAAISELSDQIDAMTGPGKAELWTLQAVKVRPEWQRVRELARAALALTDDSELPHAKD